MISAWTLALPLLLGQLQDAKSWPEFTSKEGSFKITMPTAPQTSRQKVQTAKGQMEVFLFQAEDKNEITYVVSYSDLPADDYKKGEEDQRLDYARDGAINSARGKLRTEKKLTIDGHPCRDLVIDGETSSVIRMRLHLVQRRLYQVIALGSITVTTSREVGFFLDSFHQIK